MYKQGVNKTLEKSETLVPCFMMSAQNCFKSTTIICERVVVSSFLYLFH